MKSICLIRLYDPILNIINLHILNILQFNLYNPQKIHRFLRILKFIQAKRYSNLKIIMSILHIL